MKEQELCQEKNRTNTRKSSKLSGFGRIMGNILFGLMLIVIALLVFSLVSMKMSGGPPKVAGHQMYIVLSGSMNPAFDTGSLVFVKPTSADMIKEGDIITYRGLGDGERLISHRAVAINNTEDGIHITTKGDANDATDPNPVTSDNLVGKVVLAIPYLGYLVNFTQTKQGLITLILIPAAILLIFESINLYNNVKALNKEKAVQKESQSNAQCK
ncbi:MAG: signal peptidase I [Tepidanaerobacteraceae bacterium]|nr:signal peptidase I [Thermoanaerobacterales bacterium]